MLNDPGMIREEREWLTLLLFWGMVIGGGAFWVLALG